MIRRLREDESGTSIVELGLAMFVTALMSVAMVTWMQSAGSATALYRADDVAMQDLRVAKELIGRDLRTAEGVLEAGTVSLTLWIDEDDDDYQDAGEAVTWAISEEGDLTRGTDLVEPRVHASNLAYGESYFGYDATVAADVTWVSVQLVVEVVLDDGERGTRSISIEIHVRNT